MSTDNEPATKRTKTSEPSSMLKNQYLAVQEQKQVKMRKFYKKEVEIQTINGYPIRVMVWASDEKPDIKPKKEEIKFKCEECNKEFDENKKVKLHFKKVHMNKKNLQTVETNK